MASNSGLMAGKYLVWTTEKPNMNEPRVSPPFIFQDSMWFLEFRNAGSGSYYYICIINEHQQKVRGTCDITTFIENGTDEINDSVYCHVSSVSEKSTSVLYVCHDIFEDTIPNFSSIKILRLTLNFHGNVIPKLFLKRKRGNTSVEKSVLYQSDPCFVNLSEDFKNLLDERCLCDVELMCGNHSAKAHKIILCARSKVFAAMLNSNMEECQTGVVKIQDMEADILQPFLMYVYTGTLPKLTADKAKHLYETGDKYEVFGLKRRCADFLKENFTKENVCELFISADARSDEKSRQSAIAYILDKKIPLDDQWSAFCDSHSKLAAEVLNRAYQLHMN